VRQPVITLTSDFGPSPYAGVMKGVMLGICPRARLVDLSHAVPPQDVAAGALVLEQAMEAFPYGTVHLAVVDPGVGTGRRGLCVAALGMLFVGPDNGLFTPALAADPQAACWEIAEESLLRRPVSATFHGRDVFAPVAAHLAAGLDPGRVGPLAAGPVRLDWPEPVERAGVLQGVVLGRDHFGNLATSLTAERVEAFLAGRPGRAALAGREPAPLARTFADAEAGRELALINSAGRLELAVNRGDLAARLAAEGKEPAGLAVELRPAE
jgi:hypothetical protein